MNIALVVSREGLPLGYELFAGNRNDVTTLEEEAACERAGSGLNGRELVIDLKNVTTISQQGENLLLELMQQGLKCRGCGVFTNEILKQVARRVRRNGAHE